MNMDDLYQEMKAALAYLDLGFHEKNKVKLKVTENHITFSYGGRTVTIEVGEKPNEG